eukprot:338577-Prorocentrum_minimum.AAC.1
MAPCSSRCTTPGGVHELENWATNARGARGYIPALGTNHRGAVGYIPAWGPITGDSAGIYLHREQSHGSRQAAIRRLQEQWREQDAAEQEEQTSSDLRVAAEVQAKFDRQ